MKKGYRLTGLCILVLLATIMSAFAINESYVPIDRNTMNKLSFFDFWVDFQEENNTNITLVRNLFTGDCFDVENERVCFETSHDSEFYYSETNDGIKFGWYVAPENRDGNSFVITMNEEYSSLNNKKIGLSFKDFDKAGLNWSKQGNIITIYNPDDIDWWFDPILDQLGGSLAYVQQIRNGMNVSNTSSSQMYGQGFLLNASSNTNVTLNNITLKLNNIIAPTTGQCHVSIYNMAPNGAPIQSGQIGDNASIDGSIITTVVGGNDYNFSWDGANPPVVNTNTSYVWTFGCSNTSASSVTSFGTSDAQALNNSGAFIKSDSGLWAPVNLSDPVEHFYFSMDYGEIIAPEFFEVVNVTNNQTNTTINNFNITIGIIGDDHFNSTVAYYDFDDGTATDKVNGLDGIINSAVSNVPGAVRNDTNTEGQAFHFTPNNSSNIRINNDAKLQITNQLSMSAWIKRNDATAGLQGIIRKDGANGGYGLRINNFDKIQIRIGNGTGFTNYNSVNKINDNKWHHVAATYNNSEINIYIDGVLNNTFAVTSSMVTNTNVLRIGSNPGGGGTYFNGSIDEVGIYNETLSGSQILQLFNNGLGTKVNNTIVYPTTTGIVSTIFQEGTANVTIDSPGFIPQTVSGHNLSIDLNFSLESIMELRVFDAMINTSLDNYNITSNGNISSPDINNVTQLPFNHGLINISIEKNQYLTRNLTNINASNNLNTTIWQAEINFTASEKVTGINLTNINFTAGTQTTNNDTLFMQAGNINVSLNAENYTNFTQNFTIAALEFGERQFVNVTNAIVNINATFDENSTAINTFNITVTDEHNFSFTESINTTNGSISFDLVQGYNYTFLADAPERALESQSIILNSSEENITFTLFQTNVINIQVRDEITNDLINQTVFIDLINDNFSINSSTGNGSLTLEEVSPGQYTFRFNSPSPITYNERFFEFELENRSTGNITLYLINNTLATTTTLNIIDENARAVPEAFIIVQKYDVTTNSFITREILKTNFEGEAKSQLELNTEFYKFNILRPFDTLLKVTESSYVFNNALTIQVDLRASVAETFTNKLNVDYNLSFNNATNNFVLTYLDTAGSFTDYCLTLNKVLTTKQTQVNETCLNSTSGTILMPVLPENNTLYVAVASVKKTAQSVNLVLDSISELFRPSSPTGQLGIFVVLLVTLAFGFIGRWSAPVMLITLPLPLLFATIINFVSIHWAVALAMELLMISLVIYMSRHS